MNSSELKRISLAYNNLFKSTKHFNDVREMLEEEQVNDTFNQEQIETIKKEYQQRLNDIYQFEKEIDKLEKYIPTAAFKQLKDALGQQKTNLGRMVADASGYLELGDNLYLESLVNSFEVEKDSAFALTKEMGDFATDLGFNLLRQAIENKITLEDLRLMSEAFESDSELFERVNFTIQFIERRDDRKLQTFEPEMIKPKEEERTQEKTEEPIQQEKESEPVSQQTQVEQPAKKLTLQEKIAAVNYKLGSNINAEVQELTVEDTLNNIQAQIAELQAKDKLSFKETFRLRQLMEQELAFESYREKLEEQNISRREQGRNKKLDKTLGKIEKREEELEEAIAMYQQYDSKTLRFFSERYHQKLNERLERLKSKQGELTDKQKYSAVARFDKQSKKIMRSAKRRGTINQLKEFKENLISELETIGHDFERYSSTKKQDMENMQNAVIILPDMPISLEEQQNILSNAKAA